jgi:HAD superfamily hydrolase (TIGR01549 family)
MLEMGKLLGAAGRRGWMRRVEQAIMRRPLAGLEEALPLLEEAFGLAADEGRRRRIRRVFREARGGTRLFPDVLPALRALRARGLRLALLSNTQSFDLEVLEEPALGELIEALHLSCHTGRLKPEPEAYLGVARELALPPGELLMVGDRLEDDVIGARAAGLEALLLRRRSEGLSHREEDRDEPWIGSLEELPGWLEGRAPQ